MTTPQETLEPQGAGGADADIYIVGLGISGIEHVTRETEAVLRRSVQVFALPTEKAVVEYLKSLCPRVQELHALSYVEDENRIKAYDSMSSLVLHAALTETPVTFAMYGHPLVYVYPSRQILDAAKYLGLRVKVLPGISSLDTMFVDLELDPAVEGLQMYEATDVLLRGRPLQPDVPCLLWQVGTVESVLYSTAKSRPERFRRIKEHLLRFYPPDHEVTAVYSSHHPLLKPSLVHFSLEEMESHGSDLHQGLTLYLPPVNPRPLADRELAEQVESLDYLRTIAEA